MTKFLQLLLTICILTVISCDEEADTRPKSYELAGHNGYMDTLNLIDANGLKQGVWLMPISKDTIVMLNDTGHSTKNTTTGEIKRYLKKYGNSRVQEIKKVDGKWVICPIDTILLTK